MSQEVGYQYKSRIPSFSDDASIVEALKVYHYGVDNWTTEPIPNDSIEGNFRTLHDDVSTINATLALIPGTYVEQVSASATPNVIIGQSTTTVPLTIRAIGSQTAALQQWQSSASVVVGSISTGGFINLAGYATIGNTTQASTTGLQIEIINPSDKGIVVKAQAGQSSNLQEWQNSSGTAVSWITANGALYVQGSEITPGGGGGGGDAIGSFFLMGG